MSELDRKVDCLRVYAGAVNQCYRNAESYADAYNGRVVLGWRVYDFGDLTVLVHHAVVKTDDGRYFDIGPRETHSEFLPDDSPPLTLDPATGCIEGPRIRLIVKGGFKCQPVGSVGVTPVSPSDNLAT